MDMRVDTAYERSLQTVLDWVNREVNSNKTQVFFRTYAPVHFRLVPSFFVLANLFFGPIIVKHFAPLLTLQS